MGPIDELELYLGGFRFLENLWIDFSKINKASYQRRGISYCDIILDKSLVPVLSPSQLMLKHLTNILISLVKLCFLIKSI